MSKKNKIYWFEGVTEKGVKSLLTDENSKYRWLRSQKNRRILVVLMALGTALVAAGSYWPTLKTNLNLSDGTEVVIYSVTAIFAIFAVLLGYLFLRISVRGIADAPDELLDERLYSLRNRYSFRSYQAIVLLILFVLATVNFFELDPSRLWLPAFATYASVPYLFLGWQEKNFA